MTSHILIILLDRIIYPEKKGKLLYIILIKYKIRFKKRTDRVEMGYCLENDTETQWNPDT